MRRVVVPLVIAALALSASPAIAHKSRGIRVRQRVFATRQNLDRSEADIGHLVKNRRSQAVRGRCTIIIEARWLHPVTGEIRSFTEDWSLRFRLPPGKKVRARGTIFVEHPELTADPQWQPQGVTVTTPHCHARSR